ncbi:ParB/RepB/Spo0J family partition protein [Pararhodobacter aggregans]|uniref:ParB/RepB/Spo0J family partition protein n=1 Tax=Pararhodobacter aggregans TaxID=404875 RepID=UPI003A9317F9
MLQSPPPSDETTTALVPLADCYLHPLNTRSEPPPADIEALASSIEAIGLLQNLNGWFDPAQPGKLGIVAGGRRLRAMILLAMREDRSLDETRVPVKVAPDEDTARLWASAENAARAALHPADEVRAYGRMAAKGADPDTIARAFAVSGRHVRQRLKLARLPDEALDALRDGSLSLDQAAALTVAATEDALDAELRRVLTSRWPIAASDIRHQLQRAQVRADDKRVLLIGLDAYRAAGGAVQEDLFTDQVRLLDEALLDRMVSKRLDDAVAFTLLKGWKWAEVILDSGTRWEAARKMQRIERHSVDLSDADAAELEELHRLGEETELNIDDMVRLNELEERALGDYADDDIATSGVILYLETDGTIASYGAYRRAQDDPTRAEGDPGAGASGKVETKALSAGLTEDLHKIRLAALQHRAAAQPELMLDLLGYQASGGFSAWDAPLRITLDRQPITPEKAEGLELPGSLSDPDRTIRGVTAEGFAAFRALGKKHRNEDMTQGLARTLTPHRELAPFLAAQLKPNPREIWTPTADGYFKRLPVPHLDRLWDELVPADRREGMDFQTKKKGEKATILHRLFNEADFREALGLDRATNARLDAWLPEQLQWPAVEWDSDA